MAVRPSRRAQLGVDEHAVIKTLVMQDEEGEPLMVLMHGDCTVSTKNLARQIDRKRIEPCRPDMAQRHTGYLVGGTSPFGTRKSMPVFVERTVLELPRILINGGRRGYLCRTCTCAVGQPAEGGAGRLRTEGVRHAVSLYDGSDTGRLSAGFRFICRGGEPHARAGGSAHLRFEESGRDQRPAFGQQGRPPC